MLTTGEKSFIGNLNTPGGAAAAAGIMLAILGVLVIMKITNFSFLEILHKIFKGITGIFAKVISKKEAAYHRDIQIGKITEKRTSAKLYRFLSELIIDLGLLESGITPYELLALVSTAVIIVTTIVCRIFFGNFLVALVFIPAILVGVFCVMYTKANIAHDQRIEAVIEAENIICNNIKVGVVVAVRESIDVLPKSVRPDFKDFLDNIEQKNYHIKTALQELNNRLGSVADDFIKKCIVFEMEEEHGIAGMFNDIVELNNIKSEMRTNMKRRFEEVKSEFIMGAVMIFVFLGGVIAIYPDVRGFYFHNFFGHLLILFDVMILISEYVFITYLRAKEL